MTYRHQHSMLHKMAKMREHMIRQRVRITAWKLTEQQAWLLADEVVMPGCFSIRDRFDAIKRGAPAYGIKCVVR